jgi:large subunit ribosomal protein L5
METEMKQPEIEKEQEKTSSISLNPMQEIEIEKMILNCGGTDDKLEKSIKLLEMMTKRKILTTKAKKRIPTLGLSPGKGAGCKVTLRDKEQISKLLKGFFAAVSNEIKEKQIQNNYFSFGIHEYIEIPDLEYDRDIGILGFEVSVVFKRKGKRVIRKKIKQGKFPKKQEVKKQEIINFLNKNFNVEVVK